MRGPPLDRHITALSIENELPSTNEDKLIKALSNVIGIHKIALNYRQSAFRILGEMETLWNRPHKTTNLS